MKANQLGRLLVAVLLLLSILAAGCGQKAGNNAAAPSGPSGDWQEAVAKSKGTVVNYYGWGGDPKINKWLDEVVAPGLQAKYGIKLNRVGMNAGEIINKLIGEKQAGREQGTIDLVWINGENFYNAKKNNLLYGPFASNLPAFKKYINPEDPEAKQDFGQPIDGYEAPYGKAQLVLIYDSAKIAEADVPRNYQQLLALAQKYPGKITYPAPPDFTGSAFVRNIICDIVGREKLNGLNAGDKNAVREAVLPALQYLAALKPYLWKNGETYPSTLAQLHNLFADGEVYLSMDYAPYSAAGKVLTGQFPSTVKTAVFDKGSLGNTHYLAVPFNAANKAGAMVVIDYLMSPEMQASKYNPATWGDLPAINLQSLTPQEKDLFKASLAGVDSLPGEYLQAHRLTEPDAGLVQVFDQLWLDVVVKEGK